MEVRDAGVAGAVALGQHARRLVEREHVVVLVQHAAAEDLGEVRLPRREAIWLSLRRRCGELAFSSIICIVLQQLKTIAANRSISFVRAAVRMDGPHSLTNIFNNLFCT